LAESGNSAVQQFGNGKAARQNGASEPPQHAPPALPRGIQVSERALEMIRSGLQKEGISPLGGGLRLAVVGGGCAGLAYSITFDRQPHERDRVLHCADVRLFVDPKSFIYLFGMVLDFTESGVRPSFELRTPNSTAAGCGCATSVVTTTK
jgi:iron-sulfur cluster assembly protein